MQTRSLWSFAVPTLLSSVLFACSGGDAAVFDGVGGEGTGAAFSAGVGGLPGGVGGTGFATGGLSGVGGTGYGTGGLSGVGGGVGVGGTGGDLGTGGVLGTGSSSSGGAVNTGGTSSGGAVNTGGTSSGGASSGGATGAGGSVSSGGTSSGGASSGGATSTGGASGTGGATGTGGSSGTGTYVWKTVTQGGGGFVSAVVAHPTTKNLFFARTDVGGLYRWNETDQSWLPLTDFVSDTQTGYLGVESVALDPNDANRVYALVGIDYFNGGKTAILRSTNQGNTFTVTEVTSQFKAHGNGMGRQTGERLAVDPNLGSTLLVGTRRNGLFKSTNSGATWASVTFPVTTTANDNGISLIVFDKSSSSTGNATSRIFAGVSRLGAANLYVSTNGGTSWTAVPGAPATTQMPQRAHLAGGNLFVTYANGAGPYTNGGSEPMDTGSIWKYNIAGNTWANITPAGVTRPFSGISVDASDANHLVATTMNTYMQQPWGWGDHIFVSTNGGTSWKDIVGAASPTMDANGMPWIVNHAIHWAGTAVFDPFNPSRVFVTSGNGIFATTNLSAATPTFKFMAKGLEETVPLEAVSIPGNGFASVIGDYDGFVTTNLTVSPASGIYNPAIGTTTGLGMAGAAPANLVRVGGAMYRSTNYGGTWSQVPLTGSGTKGTVALSANGTAIVWTPELSTTSYRTTNNGTSWATVTGLNANVVVLADSVNANKFYAYLPSSGAFYGSTNGGASFSQLSTPGSGGAAKARSVPGVEGDIWVPLYTGGLTRSTNSGASFTKLGNVQRADAVGFGKPDSGKTFPTVYLWGIAGGGAVGLYRSTDSGASWTRINDDLHQYGGPGNGQYVVGDMNVFGRVFMSTAGRGTIYGELN